MNFLLFLQHRFPTVLTARCDIDAEWIVTGVPFDLATTVGRSGSRFGPKVIRRASVNLAWESPRWPWGAG
ncbi:arginase family protein [Endozoicomonas sp. SESOKO1]|uniref:arginase family protein n=1 Tax=Endozoicomonas sp. SESOKO1 TaxID=2828742 RepID=UPI002148300E|nr:arginase family protein [Endozoicomonas sp. SESOKO1]